MHFDMWLFDKMQFDKTHFGKIHIDKKNSEVDILEKKIKLDKFYFTL